LLTNVLHYPGRKVIKNKFFYDRKEYQMHPIICHIGRFTIYSYGLMLAIAVLICSILLARDLEKQLGLKRDIVYDMVFWIMLAGIAGARLFYVFLNLPFFIENPLEIIMIQHGGLAWFGGLAAGVVCFLVFVKKHNLKVFRMADLLAPYLALGQSIGRIGCFLNGCCYGKRVSWGIYFPVHHARLHPTQLYSSFGLLLIFFILKKYQHSVHKEGICFVLYLLLASVLRFNVEFFRADHSPFLFNLSIFQVICIIIFCIGLILFAKIKRG